MENPSKTEKFFAYIGEELSIKSPEEIAAIKLLLENKLLVIDEEELKKVLAPPEPLMHTQREIEFIMTMVHRMLNLELGRLKDDKEEGEQLLDFGTNGIAVDFAIPQSEHAEIKKICKNKGWKVIEIVDLSIRLQKSKRRPKKLPGTK